MIIIRKERKTLTCRVETSVASVARDDTTKKWIIVFTDSRVLETSVKDEFVQIVQEEV